MRLLYKLALRMGRTVGELSATMTTDELVTWFAFDRSSPIGDERVDYMIARLCLLVADAAGMKKSASSRPRGPRDFTLEDFLLFMPRPHPAAEFRSALRHLVKRKDKK